MKATEVYSWRVERHLKQELEAAARSEQTSVARLLSHIVRDWLRSGYAAADDERAQSRVREKAEQYLGTVGGGDPSRAEQAATRAGRIIRQKHAGRRTD